MQSGFSIGYVNFTILLLFLTGAFILRFDLKGYKLANMKKEQKAARIIGAINLALGMLCLIGNWIYRSLS